jgi:hypothetical protein
VMTTCEGQRDPRDLGGTTWEGQTGCNLKK